jgi:small-conductance mechanosensitive channel
MTIADGGAMDGQAAWNTVHEMVRGFSAALPRLIFAAIVVVFFYFLSYLVKKIVRRTTTTDSAHRTLRIAMGRITQGFIIVVGTLVAAAVSFPGFSPGNVISALGVGGIAIGFAFKDIFENFLAGILILVTRPFRIGDQIIYDRFEGTVEEIQTRATWIRTYDGRRVVIPNSELFKNSVTVNTAFETRRLEYDFRIARFDQIELAKQVITQVMQESKDVLPDPKADVVVTGFDSSTVTMRARWWSRSRISDVLLAQDRVLSAARQALTSAEIKLPSTTQSIQIQDADGVTRSSTADDSKPRTALEKDQPPAAVQRDT